MAEIKCPSLKLFEEFLIGKLDEQRHNLIVEHVEHCEPCRTLIDTIGPVSDTMISSLQAGAELDVYEKEFDCRQFVDAVASIGATTVANQPAEVPAGVGPAAKHDRNDVTLPLQSVDSSQSKTLPPSDTKSQSASANNFEGIPEQFGRYKILKTLGKGGMGIVFLAEDPQLDRKVAIKIPFLDSDKQDGLDRFRREARAVAQIQHPNICNVHEVSEIGGIHYMAMAYIDGKPLDTFTRPGKPLPTRQVVKLIHILATALQYAHEVGVIHRDLKPANIIINTRNQPVIMDFGLARREGKGDVQLTQAGQLMGTPDYMSPEQVSGKVERMGLSCDIYSLGVIMYQLLTGQVPFKGDLLSVLSQIALDQPQSPSSRRPEIDGALDAICLKAMAKKPEDRYASMKDFAVALTEYSKSAGSQVEPIRSPATTDKTGSFVAADVTIAREIAEVKDALASNASAPTPSKASGPAGQRRQPRRRPSIALALVGVAAIFLCGVIIIKITRPDGTTQEIPVPDNSKIEIVDGKNDPNSTPVADAVILSPFDALDPAAIPPEERVAGQPPELVAVIGEHRQRHWNQVLCVAISPDKKLVASGGWDNCIRLWDLATQRELHVLPDDNRVCSVSFTPDGQRLVCATYDAGLSIWDLSGAAPKLQKKWKGAGRTTMVSLSPDAQTLARATEVSDCELWDLSGAEPSLRAKLPGIGPAAVFSPDGKTLAVSQRADRTVRLYDLTEAIPKAGPILPGPEGILCPGNYYSPMQFSSDGRLATIDATKNLRLWNVTGPEPRSVASVKVEDTNLAFAPGGRWLATFPVNGASTQVWDLAGDVPVLKSRAQRLHWNESGLTSVAITPDGQALVTGAYDGAVCFWDTAGAKGIEKKTVNEPPCARNRRVFLTDDRTVLLSKTVSTHIWNAGGPTMVARESPEELTERQLARTVSPDGKTLVSSRGTSVLLWTPQQGTLDFRCRFATKDSAYTATFTPDGKTLALSGANTISLWDVSGKVPKELATASTPAETISFAFANDGRQLVSRHRDNLERMRLWDVTEAGLTEREGFKTYPANNMTVSPDGQTLGVCIQGGDVQLWDVGGNTPENRLSLPAKDSYAVAFAPDGQTLATANGYNTVSLWEIDTGRKLRELKLPGQALSLSYTPDGRHLISGNGNGTVYVLRLAKPTPPPKAAAAIPVKELKAAEAGNPLDGLDATKIPVGERFEWQPKELVAVLGSHAWRHWGTIVSVSMHPDGKLIASAGSIDGVRLWEAATGKQLAAWPGTQVAFSPDGLSLAIGGVAELMIADVASLKTRATFKGVTRTLALAYSSDSKSLAAWYGEGGVAANQAIQVFDVATQTPRFSVQVDSFTKRVFSIALSADGNTIAAGCIDGLKLWDVDTAASLAAPDLKNAFSVALSPDNNWVAAYADGGLKLWNRDDGSVYRSLVGHTEPVTCLTFSSDGKTLASAGNERWIRTWDAVSGTAGKVFSAQHAGNVVSFSGNGQTMVAGGRDASVRIWEMTTSKQLNEFSGYPAQVDVLSLAPNGRTFAMGNLDYGAFPVVVWDAIGNQKAAAWVAENDLEGLAVSKDGTMLVTTGDRGIQFWRFPSGRKTELRLLQSDHPKSVAHSPDGTAISAVVFLSPTSSELRTWQLATGALLSSFPIRGPVGDYQHWLTYSPDGSLLARCDSYSGPLQVWDLAAKKVRFEIKQNADRSRFWDPVFSRDGKRLLAVVNDGKYGPTVYDTTTGRVLATYHGEHLPGGAKCAVFVGDDKTIISAGYDGKLIEWSPPFERRVLCQLPGPVNDLAVSSDGRYLFTANSNGTVYVLRLN